MSGILPAALNIANGVTTSFLQTVTTNSGGNANTTIRSVLTPSVSGSEIRVTVNAGGSGAMTLSHVSIGIQSSGANTTATPVELKFSGASGCTVSASGTLASDWTPFVLTGGVPVICIADITSANIAALSSASFTSYSAAGTSWSTATVSGFTTNANLLFIFSQIEVR